MSAFLPLFACMKPLTLPDGSPVKAMLIGTSWKKCPKCGEAKALSEFYRKGDGHRSYCKACCLKKNSEDYRKRASPAQRNGSTRPHTRDAKTCMKCLEMLPTTAFYRQAKGFMGTKSMCIACMTPMLRKRSANRLESISRSYVASILGIPARAAPDSLIELKREQIRLHRLARELKQEIHNQLKDPK